MKFHDDQKLLSIVFSFRNEVGNIRELVERTAKVLGKIDGWSYELVFVDDNSDDGSLDLLLELQDKFPIRIVCLSRQFGVGPGILAGLKHARGNAVAYLDCDLQDPPELLPILLARFESGFDIVHTTRSARLGETWIKYSLTQIAYFLISIFSDMPLRRDSGDFKLLSRRALEAVTAMSESDPYLRGLPTWVGFSQDFVKYERGVRFKGKSHFPILSPGPISEFFRGITFSTVRIRLFFVFLILYSLVVGLVFFVVGVGPSSKNYLYLSSSFGPLLQVNLILLLFSSGLLGVFSVKILNQLRNRPRYIIKEVREPRV